MIIIVIRMSSWAWADRDDAFVIGDVVKAPG